MEPRVLIINCSPVRTGATAEIVRIIEHTLKQRFDVRSVCIDDYKIGFCKGCRTCHETAKCVLSDDAEKLMNAFQWADQIVLVAPSYWADVPGQFKVFIDRCTPWSNTHEPHAALSGGKKGYAVALRTGPNLRECQKLIGTMEHFFGHLEIIPSGSLGLCSLAQKEQVAARREEIEAFCEGIT